MSRSLINHVLWFAVLVAPHASAEPTPNSLRKSEIADGWVLLFDGASTFCWSASDASGGSWTVEDDALVGRKIGAGSQLRHDAVFENFELTADVSSQRGARATIALVDDSGKSSFATTVEFDDKKAGAWKSVRLLARGDRITTTVNGTAKTTERSRSRRRVRIGLAVRGGAVRFRDIKLKPLGLESIFNGADLTGWRVVEPPTKPNQRLLKQNWTVTDGLLHVDVPALEGIEKGGRGNLETTGQYADFVLQLQARTNGAHFNSGVFFRCIPKKIGQGYEAQIRNQWKGDDRTQPVDFGTGGIYRRVPARKVVSSDREFFTMTLATAGPRLVVWVDGYPVTDFLDTRAPSDNARQGYRAGAGTISLQSHDPTTDLDFRNLRVAELPAAR